MKCKYCQAELEDGASVCSACGKEMEPEAVQEEVTVQQEPAAAETSVQEEQAEECASVGEAAPVQEAEDASQPEMKEGIKVTPGKIALAIAAGVLLLAALVSLVISGIDGASNILHTNTGADESQSVTTDPQIAVTEASEAVETEPEVTVPATVPADGNPDDVTCKGSYTASDADVIAAGDTVVATMGDKTLTVRELQVYYWMEVRALVSEYGDYIYYFGMDPTQPLDTQICQDGTENPGTWQQFFLAMALNAWMRDEALALEADAAGHQMGEEYAQQLKALPETLASNAAYYGLADANELVQKNVGMGAGLEDYQRYMELYYKGYSYYESLYNAVQPTDAQIEAYFVENEDYFFNEHGVTKEDGKLIDVRHILLQPDDANAATGEDGYPVYSEEAWEACLVEAEALYEQWKSGDATEESFAALANEHSVDSDGTDGGLYTDVYEGYMVQTFNDWCFDAARQPGDHGLVKTQYGYHIMYFVGSRDIWYATAKEELIDNLTSAIIPAIMEKHPATVDYSAIKLAYVNFAVQ